MSIPRGMPKASLILTASFFAMTTSPDLATASATWTTGPSGSLVVVEEVHTLPLITVVVAARSGSNTDPERQEGLSNLAAEVARRGAGGRDREALDDALDDLGATLDALVDVESTRFVGRVLARNFEPFMDLLADVILRPSFAPEEVDRTRREVVAQLAEARNDDRSLCSRAFARRLWGRHPYGQPADGSETSLPRLSRAVLQKQFKAQFSGSNVIFAASGAIAATSFAEAVHRRFAKLPTGRLDKLDVPRAVAPQGWRIQLVDKPDRQQVQMMLGHLALPPTHEDYIPLTIALTAFGGQAMNATLMNEVRTQRGWAYGAYMNPIPYREIGAVRAWVFTGVDHAVETLKLVLRLYTDLVTNPPTDDSIAFFKKFLAGSYASELDSPHGRLWRRVVAEIQALPRDWVDQFPERVTAASPAAVRAAVQAHLKPKDLAITMVGTAEELVPLLTAAGIDRNAIDVVPFTVP